jgi:hypothetical protein
VVRGRSRLAAPTFREADEPPRENAAAIEPPSNTVIVKAEPLEFPRGIRWPRPEEVPAAHADAYGRIREARITTGFVRKATGLGGYTDIIEANVHASRLFAVFRDVGEAIIPSAAAPIVGFKGEDPLLGPYTTRDAALAVLEPYAEPLQHDGFLEFGIIFQRGGRTEEVFIPNVKFLRIWTSRPDDVVSVLCRHGVPEMPDLQFIDEYPRVSQALPFEGHEAGWFPVLEALKERFQSLPDPPPPGA